MFNNIVILIMCKSDTPKYKTASCDIAESF